MTLGLWIEKWLRSAFYIIIPYEMTTLVTVNVTALLIAGLY